MSEEESTHSMTESSLTSEEPLQLLVNLIAAEKVVCRVNFISNFFQVEEEIEEVTEEFATEDEDSVERTKVKTTTKVKTAADKFSSSLLSVECALASDVVVNHHVRVSFPEFGIDLIDLPSPSSTPLPDLEDGDDGAFLMATPYSWEDNWLFQRRLSKRASSFRRRHSEPVAMLVPNPDSAAPGVTIGGREADELSELSERRSVVYYSDDQEDQQEDLEHTECAVLTPKVIKKRNYCAIQRENGNTVHAHCRAGMYL